MLFKVLCCLVVVQADELSAERAVSQARHDNERQETTALSKICGLEYPAPEKTINQHMAGSAWRMIVLGVAFSFGEAYRSG